MTPQEEKQLAESGVKFLGGFFDKEIGRWVLPEGIWNFIGRTIHEKDLSHLFFNGQYKPILMHLAKREMEKLGWNIQTQSSCDINPKYKHRVVISKELFGAKDFWRYPSFESYDENEFKAMWTAIWRAINEKN